MPTAITGLRTIAAVALIALAAATHSLAWLLAGLVCYWVGDIADGVVARRTDTETRTGATLDILCDRLCAAFFYLAYASLHPEMLVPIVVFLCEFMVVDNYLSLAFAHWPLQSPNYFGLVDRRLYVLNWSPLGKAANSGLVAVLMLTTGLVWLVATLAVCLLVVKMYSLVRLHRLPLPQRTGCAVAAAGGSR